MGNFVEHYDGRGVIDAKAFSRAMQAVRCAVKIVTETTPRRGSRLKETTTIRGRRHYRLWVGTGRRWVLTHSIREAA
jgi:hypothetical protein